MKYCFWGFIGVFLSFWGCKTAKPVPQAPPEPVILSIGDKKFTTDEFFQSFTKNQFSDDTSKSTNISEYLQLFTNLKLKVIAAQSEGKDTTAAFREELAAYRKQLAQPYLTDRTLVENLVAEAYERMKEEIKASHILIAVSPDASPEDTLSAYRSAIALRSRILQQEITFEEAAGRFSKDAVSASKGGDLGYFTVFQTVYPFENAAYNASPQIVSDPIRTKSGYHLIKVTDRRPSRGKIQVAHILVRISANATPEGKAAAKARIEKAHSLLQQEAWEVVCRDYSDEPTTKDNGGILNEFGTGSMTPAFEEAAFSLKRIGDISQPFLSNYGWHIVKLINRKPIESFSELSPQLHQKVTTDSRGELIREALVAKLHKEYKLTETALYNEVLTFPDSNLLTGKWKFREPLTAALDKKALVQIANQPYTVNQFFEYVYNRQQPVPAGTSLTMLMQRYYRQFVNQKLIEIEEANLEKKHPDFKALMTEMRDGVLFTQALEANVLEPSLTDSLGQKQYWEQNKANYRYSERAFATLVVSDSDTLLKRAQESLSTKPYQLRRKGNDLLFPTSATALSVKHREALFEVALTLLNNENYLVEVSSYGDADEPDSVSTLRLQNAIKALTNNNVPLTRIIEKDYGKFKPVANAARNRRVSFQYFSTSKKDLEKALNALKLGTVLLTEGAFAKGTNRYIDAARWEVGNHTVNFNNQKIWISITKIEPARIKTFAEARGAVINDFQKQLEHNWLNQLRQKFVVQINEEELRKLAK
ncbi:peptidylprolyl isomerase [Runella slithyformis]|uniref:PpiC-type peptidyl-prolyl cis-trans isomerase n=1 Tax=Runella slithyformis (strain ATCC 29530 / DSM 19594 / LMG 11500 / NCIMB 11436 / LSU 4) TaxID=761193 RepID=A0A7U3ZPS5_RUNSL|nr:peptidylprolyl isomerase [Runella slithyformis]AEI51120.1 PpiC-type peptidyl-prolyl cis-trans isomerase [Runella slithyformis DSM 19594]